MANRKVRADENWKPVRGAVIPGILFEVDENCAPRLRIKRGRHVEIIDLAAYGFARFPAQSENMVYNNSRSRIPKPGDASN